MPNNKPEINLRILLDIIQKRSWNIPSKKRGLSITNEIDDGTTIFKANNNKENK